MRKNLRKSLKEGFKRIAVVCGAWHAPALYHFKNYKIGEDNALLKGQKKHKTHCTWVPWTYERIAKQSGYGAGVISPAWYEYLFTYSHEATNYWLIKAADLLRNEGYSVSSKHIIDAVHLVKNLSAIRSRPNPGLDELKDAAVSVFLKGNKKVLQFIDQKLIIGEKIGKVPEDISGTPLQKDFTNKLKELRLKKYWENPGVHWLKSTKTNPFGGIDLRNKIDLHKSQFFYQLDILGIDWARKKEVNEWTLGSFKEIWQLNWRPDLLVKVIESGTWGNTIRTGAQNLLDKKVDTERDFIKLLDLLILSFNADLKKKASKICKKLNDLGLVEDGTVTYLLGSLPSLSKVLKYGNLRQYDKNGLFELFKVFLPKISAEIETACSNLNEEAAGEMLKSILDGDWSISLLSIDELSSYWVKGLHRLADGKKVHQLIKGLACRLLFNRNYFSIDQTRIALSLETSSGKDITDVSFWIEGFLNGHGSILIHNRELWKILNSWITSLDEDRFRIIVPILRRTFSKFSIETKEKIWALVKKEESEDPKIHIGDKLLIAKPYDILLNELKTIFK